MSLHYLVKHELPKNQRNSPCSTKANESQHSAVKYLVLLRQGLLPEMRELSDFFTFQQDSAPAHLARPTVELLEKEVPDFISPSLWPLNSPVLNPVDLEPSSGTCISNPSATSTNCVNALLQSGKSCRPSTHRRSHMPVAKASCLCERQRGTF